MAKKKKKQSKKNSPSASTASSRTILVHGTFSQDIGQWHRPTSRFHRFVKTYFPDTYSGGDYFSWSGDADDAARLEAARCLIEWCQEHPADQFNFIAHSHGANVVSLATNHGLENVNRLIYLSPPVWATKPGYLPNMDVVSHKVIFNFHPQNDRIVTDLANAEQDYGNSAVARYEDEYIVRRWNHWAPVRVRNWRAYNIGEIVSGAAAREPG